MEQGSSWEANSCLAIQEISILYAAWKFMRAHNSKGLCNMLIFCGEKFLAPYQEGMRWLYKRGSWINRLGWPGTELDPVVRTEVGGVLPLGCSTRDCVGGFCTFKAKAKIQVWPQIQNKIIILKLKLSWICICIKCKTWHLIFILSFFSQASASLSKRVQNVIAKLLAIWKILAPGPRSQNMFFKIEVYQFLQQIFTECFHYFSQWKYGFS
jgi:hypothetical protein